MSSAWENFLPKRHEGKPIPFRIKYYFANYPGIAIGFVVAGIISPLLTFAYYYTNGTSRYESLKKYKPFYFVMRDDDPQLQKYIEQKESGRHLFPK